MKWADHMLAGLCGAVLSLASAGCPPRSAPAPTTLASPAPATQASNKYDNAKFGLDITEPAGYSPKPSDDYDLLLVPAKAPATPIDFLSLEAPDLPVHIPGFIPLNMVVSGYIDDLKKSHANLTVDENQAYTIPDAKASIVQSHWPDGQTTDMESAILIVHGDHVFILRADADAAGKAKTLQDYDAFVKSLQWKK
jgi:hypothetical protein